MRKEAAFVLVLAALGWGAVPASASASASVVAHWNLDEGSGQQAADSGPNGAHGRLGWSGAADSNDPAWTGGHDGGAALFFGGSQYVAVPDSAALEPAHVAVDAWVRHSGSPGRWRYVLSKDSVGCDRSAYGLYSGWAGGMSFYVSSSTHYMISPEVPVSVIWDGAWHHVVGAYDGSHVRLWVDGAQVGDGTPATVSIAYGIGSKGVYIGTYRGSCELGFTGDVDDVRVWDDTPQPLDPTLPVIPPTPGTPTQLPVSGGPASSSGGSSSQKHTVPRACLRVSLNRRNVPVGKRTRVVATVRRGKGTVVGVRVIVKGAGVTAGGRTNRVGRAGVSVWARKRGRLTVRIRNEKASCPARTIRAS
jgi:concanavalin A-like lectin/glucanase superfamily protein